MVIVEIYLEILFLGIYKKGLVKDDFIIFGLNNYMNRVVILLN